MTSYSEDFRQRALRQGKYVILDKKFLYVNPCTDFYDKICDEPCQCCHEFHKKEKKIIKKYNFKPCLVINTTVNRDYDYMVKFNDGKVIDGISRSCLFKVVHRETYEEIEDYDNINFDSYGLVRL